MENLIYWLDIVEETQDRRQKSKVWHRVKDIVIINLSKPAHIVSAWSETHGYCQGERAVEKKSNEITAISLLLDQINIKNQVITIDAIGTQAEISKKFW